MSTAIPYTVEARPDTGLNNVKIGIWLFLASEVMLFGALFASYILLRAGGTTWPEQSELLNVPLATVNTIVLITSSVTMVMAWASLMRKKFRSYCRFMDATVLLGFVFLVIKYFEYSAKFEHHLYPSSNAFLAIYFTLTGLHALHVVLGMLYNAWLGGLVNSWLKSVPVLRTFSTPWADGAKMWKTNPVQFTNRVEAAGLFWHFVDLVWIFLFPVLYLL